VLALLLVAFSLGLSNFAAAVGIGVAGVDARARLLVGLVFGVFEAGMPVVGLLAGHALATALGHATRWAGGGLLVATGCYALVQTWRDRVGGTANAMAAAQQRAGQLVITGLALSIDNLAVGFALGTYHVPFAVAAAVIGAVSVTLSLAGLELGARIGGKACQRGEMLGGVILIAVGAAIAAGIL
jgi:manganese efflux pump family protein